jgi:hypothetical protein
MPVLKGIEVHDDFESRVPVGVIHGREIHEHVHLRGGRVTQKTADLVPTAWIENDRFVSVLGVGLQDRQRELVF